MSAKDTVVGTAERLGAEIVGDGRLAEEGTRQAAGLPPNQTSDAIGGGRQSPSQRSMPQENPAPHAALTVEERYAALLGHAALKVWSDLPREAQELLFNASVDGGIVANSLAVFLHNRHPRTAHPPKPTQFA
jgi:hypothetical protein